MTESFPTVRFDPSEVAAARPSVAKVDQACSLFETHGAVRLLDVLARGFLDELRDYFLHRYRAELSGPTRPDRGPLYTVNMSGPPGSVLMTDSRVVHRGSPNRSQRVRPLLYNTYHRSWFRDRGGYQYRPSVSTGRRARRQVPEQCAHMFRIADESAGQPEGPGSPDPRHLTFLRFRSRRWRISCSPVGRGIYGPGASTGIFGCVRNGSLIAAFIASPLRLSM